MQNRLDSAAEARAANGKQLAELQAVITAEPAARPESVDRNAALARLAVARSTLTELHAELEDTARVTLSKWKQGVGPWCSRKKLRRVTQVKDNATRPFPSARHLRTVKLMKMADNFDFDVPFHSAA
jgi:hypothetical protein